MTTHREMTKEELERVLGYLVGARSNGADLALEVGRVRAHIAALEAKAATVAKALDDEKRTHAETRAMHSQMCQVAMQHQRDRDNARDAALEEAAQVSDFSADDASGSGFVSDPDDEDGRKLWSLVEERHRQDAKAVRALKTQPARRFVDAETLEDAAQATIAAGPNPDVARNFGPNSVHSAAVRDLMSRVTASLGRASP